MAKLLDNPSATLGQGNNIFWQQWLYKLWVAVTQGLVISSASQTIGKATLVGGTVIVPSTAIQTSSVVQVTHSNVSGTPGVLYVPVSGITPGTSFVINSGSGSDASVVSWVILQPV